MVVAVALAIAAAPASGRPGDLSGHLLRVTNARYDHDCFWGGPRGAGYGELPNAQPIQKANLYPDIGSTYFAGQFKLPAGASLRFDGRIPRVRYFSYAIQTQLGDGVLGAGDFLRDDQIRSRSRRYTMHVVGGNASGARNTVATGSTDPEAQVTLVLRHYIPAPGKDGTGDAGLPKLALRLADGTTQTGAQACATLQANKDQSRGTFPLALWKDLVSKTADPVNDPAPYPPAWERFWNIGYSVLGLFIGDQAKRARTYPPTDDGGFGSNPDTRYLTTGISLEHGRVYVVSARMPRRRQLRYWSLCTGSAPTSGLGYDCVFDSQVALRHRRYTIAVTKPGDRPANARARCGVTWLDFGGGERHPDGTGRSYEDVLYMRFIDPDPGWAHAPQRVKTPAATARVMGAFFPTGRYRSVKAFEKRGCR